MRPKTTVVSEADSFSFHHTHDVTSIIEGVKEMSELITRSTKNAAGANYLGSIDTITASIWATECGAAVGTKEFAKYAKKKLMSPEYSKFRADVK
jgi:hypothetical protein